MRSINKMGIFLCLMLVCMPILGNAGVIELKDKGAIDCNYIVTGIWGWGEENITGGDFKVEVTGDYFSGVVDGVEQYIVTGVFNSTGFKGNVFIDGEPEVFYGSYRAEGDNIFGVWFWRRGYGWFEGEKR